MRLSEILDNPRQKKITAIRWGKAILSKLQATSSMDDREFSELRQDVWSFLDYISIEVPELKHINIVDKVIDQSGQDPGW